MSLWQWAEVQAVLWQVLNCHLVVIVRPILPDFLKRSMFDGAGADGHCSRSRPPAWSNSRSETTSTSARTTPGPGADNTRLTTRVSLDVAPRTAVRSERRMTEEDPFVTDVGRQFPKGRHLIG
jgi:hypothetical protein